MLSLPADVMSNLARLTRAFESIAASLELLANPPQYMTAAQAKLCAYCGATGIVCGKPGGPGARCHR